MRAASRTPAPRSRSCTGAAAMSTPTSRSPDEPLVIMLVTHARARFVDTYALDTLIANLAPIETDFLTAIAYSEGEVPAQPSPDLLDPVLHAHPVAVPTEHPATRGGAGRRGPGAGLLHHHARRRGLHGNGPRPWSVAATQLLTTDEVALLPQGRTPRARDTGRSARLCSPTGRVAVRGGRGQGNREPLLHTTQQPAAVHPRSIEAAHVVGVVVAVGAQHLGHE